MIFDSKLIERNKHYVVIIQCLLLSKLEYNLFRTVDSTL